MATADRLAHAERRLDEYYKAESAVLNGQEYRIGTRMMKYADLTEIRLTIEILEKRVDELQAEVAGKGARKSFRVIPRDL